MMTLKGASLFMSENKDFGMNDLPPAVSTSQTATITNAETLHGLVVADELGCVGFTNFTLEKPKPVNAWGFSGNNGAGKWLGTRDSSDLVIKTNNTERVRIFAAGNVEVKDTLITDNLRVNGSARFDTLYANRIISIDSVLFVGDSSLVLDGPHNRIYGHFLGQYKGLGLGMNTYARGWYSSALGYQTEVTSTATKAIVIGSGSSTHRLTNTTSNSLMIGFNSNIATLFVSGSEGNNTTGNVGIGTSNPTEKLDVNGNVKISGLASQTGSLIQVDANGVLSTYPLISGNSSGFWNQIPSTNHIFYSTSGGNVGIGTTNNPVAKLEARLSANAQNQKAASFTLAARDLFFVPMLVDGANAYNPLATTKDLGIIWTDGMGTDGKNVSSSLLIGPWNSTASGLVIAPTGKVGIGTNNPVYDLDVCGEIRARKIRVNLQGCDFVFENDYNLMPLPELEQYLIKNKHLPDVAPAKEMETEHGVELGEMQSKLLQKVEELTLYIIEQNNRIVTLENQIKNFKK